jgi:hypothetical protein
MTYFITAQEEKKERTVIKQAVSDLNVKLDNPNTLNNLLNSELADCKQTISNQINKINVIKTKANRQKEFIKIRKK